MPLRFHTRLALLLPLFVLLAGCTSRAQETGQPVVTKDVVYGVVGGEELKLDTYVPVTPGPHPGLLLIHGGGWSAGSKSGEANTAQNLAQHGVVCFAVEYRFAPKYTWPAQILDCARAARWVRANADKYGLDPARLGAMGGSAGGHLSLMLGVIKPDDYQSTDDPNRALSAKVKCVVDVFGPTDLRGEAFSPLAAGILAKFIGVPPGGDDVAYADASPITHATSEASPVFFLHGDKDTLVPLRQSEVMKAKLDELGVANELVVIKNGDHGFGKADPQELSAAYGKAMQWLAAQLF